LQDGINQLAAAGAQSQAQLQTVANQIARSLFTSTYYETLPPARTDVQYVTDLYYAYLQRGPDDSGLGFWTGQAAGSRVNVCNAFEVSGEFQTLVANLYGTAASDNERTEHFVNNFYLGAYGRNATPTELQQQRDALNAAAQNQAAVQAQAETFGRSLFAAQVNDASISNTQFVTNLYEAFLQRGPDTVGLGNWSGQASVGSGRQNALNAFATFPAFRELSGTLYREANWLVTDHLGTPRMIVNKSGSLTSVRRHDYLPFGEELLAGLGGRTTAQGYTADSVRQKFTRKERDNETGLDYSIHRYYSSTHGRFTSPDPLLSSGRPAVPDSWNRYTYVLNNPLALVDPDGLDWGVSDWDKNGHRTYRWFNGNKMGKGYTAVVFDESGSRDIVSNGSVVRIANHGIIRQVIYGGPGGDGPSGGQENLNAAAGMVDGNIPFGRQIREAAFGKMGVDTSAAEYEHAATISTGVVIGVTGLAAGGFRIAGCLVETSAPTRIYAAGTLLRMEEESGPMHNFPESFNAEIFQASRTVTRDFFNVDKQALSNDSIMYRAAGSINGKVGTFEIGVRPSVSGRTEIITHRFFNPAP